MIFKKIGNMENVEVICHYFGYSVIKGGKEDDEEK
jgi:hypothetical protein